MLLKEKIEIYGMEKFFYTLHKKDFSTGKLSLTSASSRTTYDHVELTASSYISISFKVYLFPHSHLSRKRC